jgi:hypothetical protein
MRSIGEYPAGRQPCKGGFNEKVKPLGQTIETSKAEQPLISSAHDVIHGSGILHPQFARHELG